MAQFTLFDLHVGAHEKVGTITYGVSSAGSTITLNDRTLSSGHADDQFSDGVIYFLESTNVSIQGQFRRISDYDASSGQYTFTTLSSAVTTATQYGVATPEFNLSLMNRLANAALRTLGPLVYVDRSLVSSANQKVYTLSTLVGRSRPFRVDIMGRTGSSADNPDWTELHGWHIQPSTEGAAHSIVFPRYLPSGRDIRIFYEADHSSMTASTQLIDRRLHPELVTLALVEKMYEFRNSRARGAQEFDVQRWNDSKRQLAEARVRWPTDRPRKKIPTLRIDDEGYMGGDWGDVPPWSSPD